MFPDSAPVATWLLFGYSKQTTITINPDSAPAARTTTRRDSAPLGNENDEMNI